MTEAFDWAFDVETFPLLRSLEQEYPADERNPPANYKSEDAITRWREKDYDEWERSRIKTYSLNPRLGRVVAIGYASDRAANTGADLAKTEADEPGVLKRFWELVEGMGVIYTWNGHGFDIPFIITRSLLTGVKVPPRVRDLRRRYSDHPHCDLKMFLLNWPSGGYVKGEGLNEWAQAFGLSPKSGHGSQVYEQVRQGKWADLGEYATDDAVLTWEIAKRVREVMG